MARSSPSLWGIGHVPLLSQRESEALPRKLGKKVRLVPTHMAHSWHFDDRITTFCVEAVFITLAMIDIYFQVVMVRYLAQSIADDHGVVFLRKRKASILRTMAYALHLIDYIYRLSVWSSFFDNWEGLGSKPCRKLQHLLPKTSYSYKCLRGTTTMGICSVLLYGVVESPYLFSKTGIKNPAERFMADFLSSHLCTSRLC